MARESDEQLSRAVILYLGFGERSAPLADPGRVVEEFGSTRGGELVEDAVSALGWKFSWDWR